MEGMLQAVVIVFMLFLCSLCLFAVIVIVRDIIHENAKNRRAREMKEIYDRLDAVELAELLAKANANRAEEEKTPDEDVAEQPVEEVVEEIFEEPATEDSQEEPAPADENAVTFSRHTLTLEERYATLSTEYKRYFDDIVRHALTKEGVRELKYSNHCDYKIGAYKVLRITIKRGEIVCQFQFLDRDFLNYANSSSVKMKQSATTVKVTEPSAVGAVKDGIDLVCNQIAEDKEYKKNLANEKRREKRRKEREENAIGETEANKENVNV